MKDLKLEALKKRYEAQIAESKATLEVYLTNHLTVKETIVLELRNRLYFLKLIMIKLILLEVWM